MARWCFLFIILLEISSPTFAFLGFDFHGKSKTGQAKFSEKKHVNSPPTVKYIYKTLDTLQYSAYKLGGSQFDVMRGVYVIDCSNYVDQILQVSSPQSYLSLVNSSGTDYPTTQHYFDFFTGLTDDPYWDKIDHVKKLQPGDIIVFRYKKRRHSITRGHVMVVMDKPIPYGKAYLVKVADSAPTRHSDDTRPAHVSGIGVGNLLLKVHPKTGKPQAYAWGMNSDWRKNVRFAMARPTDLLSAE